MKNGLTEAQRTENLIYTQIERARRLQAIPKCQLATALRKSNARITQIWDDRSMSVRQMCELLEAVGLEITICASSDVLE